MTLSEKALAAVREFRELSNVLDLPLEKLLSETANDTITAATVAFAGLDCETRERVELAFSRRLRGLSDSVPAPPGTHAPSLMAQMAVCSYVIDLLRLVRRDEEPCEHA